MSRSIIHLTKYVAERIDQSVDFSGVLEGGESISTRDVKAYDAAGGDVTSTLIDSVSGSGTQITYTLKEAGTPKATYWIDVEATLNTSEIHIQRFKLSIGNP